MFFQLAYSLLLVTLSTASFSPLKIEEFHNRRLGAIVVHPHVKENVLESCSNPHRPRDPFGKNMLPEICLEEQKAQFCRAIQNVSLQVVAGPKEYSYNIHLCLPSNCSIDELNTLMEKATEVYSVVGPRFEVLECTEEVEEAEAYAFNADYVKQSMSLVNETLMSVGKMTNTTQLMKNVLIQMGIIQGPSNQDDKPSPPDTLPSSADPRADQSNRWLPMRPPSTRTDLGPGPIVESNSIKKPATNLAGPTFSPSPSSADAAKKLEAMQTAVAGPTSSSSGPTPSQTVLGPGPIVESNFKKPGNSHPSLLFWGSPSSAGATQRPEDLKANLEAPAPPESGSSTTPSSVPAKNENLSSVLKMQPTNQGGGQSSETASSRPSNKKQNSWTFADFFKSKSNQEKSQASSISDKSQESDETKSQLESPTQASEPQVGAAESTNTTDSVDDGDRRPVNFFNRFFG